MNMFKPLIVASLVLECLAVSAVAETEEDPSPTAKPVKVAVVEKNGSARSYTYPAIVLPSKEVDVSFRVGGYIEFLPIRAAGFVKKGDIVARLDTRDFQSQVKLLESQVDMAEAQLAALLAGARPEEVAILEAAKDAARANLDQSLEQFEREQALVARGVISQAQFEQVQSNLKVARANMSAASQELDMAIAGGRHEDIVASKANIRGLNQQLKTANDNLDDATLRAPFDGIIARRDVDEHAIIQAGQPVALLQEISTVHVVFDVPASDISELAAGARAGAYTEAAFAPLPHDHFPAKLVEFSTQAQPGTQTYNARAAVEVPQGTTILPGMVAELTTSYTLADSDFTSIPMAALASQANGDPFVWLVESEASTVSKQTVVLGESMGERVVVVDGLDAGDVVVSAGTGQLHEGMLVQPLSEED